MEIKTSVKDIVEFIYGSGDLVSDSASLKRAEEGTIIHQEHQSKYKETDESEVYVDYEVKNENYSLFISGRIDGVLKRNKKLLIEEIKSTTKELESIDEFSAPAHLAQAKMYAYFYALKHNKKKINVRLTYIHVSTKKIKKFDFNYTLSDLQTFFEDTINQYITWLKVIDAHEVTRNKSIEGLQFPFDHYRDGQRELMGACYKTILSQDVLYAIAPTGIGKTIATIFSSLKAINQKNQKLFYLTAKNLGKQIALDTIKLLISRNLIIKAIEITAKESICLQETRDCDPEKCPYSKGYFNRVYKAVKDLHEHESIFSKETIVKYALKHQVCPFEFSLDASNYADIVICDYNYAFCPLTHLIRYFDDSKFRPILLIDEAHNLVSRSKDMYSGCISKIRMLTLAKLLKENKASIKKDIADILNYINIYESKLEKTAYQVIDFDVSFVNIVDKLLKWLGNYLNDHKSIIHKSEIVKITYEMIRFTKIAELYDEDFVFTIEKIDHDILVNINCLDASKFILNTVKEKTVSSVFFSATLYPISYYKQSLTQDVGKFIKIDSPFDQHHLNLITIDDVSTRYNDRPNSVEKIVDVIRILGDSKVGNYIVFFPSYQYLSMVYEQLEKHQYDFEYILQKRDFSLKEREDVINLFKQQTTKTQFGLFVMGGMFAEGIDYIGDMLSGVIIVGTGLPMYGGYNNIVKSFFDEKFGNGFDFAYTFPGFSKVVQAVGRVIRTESDRGVAILIDDRFSSIKYINLYPKEWSHMKRIIDLGELSDNINEFWIINKVE